MISLQTAPPLHEKLLTPYDTADDAIFSRVYVFTRDMVSRSHALTVDDASMSAILTLGEERVDREQRISVLEERLGRVRDDLKEVEKRRKECEDELDNLALPS